MYGAEELELSEQQIRTSRHAYYAAISYLDKVGELLRALRDAGFEDDTVIVFTADHGEMLGERGSGTRCPSSSNRPGSR
jgi:choline-sulfatase